MKQDEWARRLTRVVAGEVRRHRLRQKMSAQQLSDRCADLGLPIQRSVLANFEAGRRESVSVAELVVLGNALGVPPAMLVFPLGHENTIEIASGLTIPTWDAVKWFTGEAPLTSPSGPRGEALSSVDDFDSWQRGALPVESYREHERLLNERRSALVGAAGARHAAEVGEPSERDGHRRLEQVEAQRAREYERALREHRAFMYSNGITALPELPPDLIHLDEQ